MAFGTIQWVEHVFWREQPKSCVKWRSCHGFQLLIDPFSSEMWVKMALKIKKKKKEKKLWATKWGSTQGLLLCHVKMNHGSDHFTQTEGSREVIIYQTICLNDYVQLCHINAFYYGNMYIYCQMPKKKRKWDRQRPRLHSCSLKWKVLQTGKSRANKHSLTLPTRRIDPGGVLFVCLFFLNKFYFLRFWSVQHSLRYSSPPPTHRPSMDWPELQRAGGLWKTGQLHPARWTA